MTLDFDKAYGALLGVFVGDAAGAPLEFIRSDIKDDTARQAMHMPGGGVLRVAPGQITDDGELTLSLAHALEGRHPSHGLPLEDIALSYAKWMMSQPFDVGNTCRRAFAIMDKNMQYPGMGKVPLHCIMMQRASQGNEVMEANGSLMRIVPIAIWSVGQPVNTIAHNARMDALLSHPNRVCQDCNALYCIAIAYLLRHPGDADGAIDVVRDYMEGHHVHPTVVEWFMKSGDISKLTPLRKR
jgi:ADP-ribosyl-[dinitrogen reductase] hydrolase